MPSGRVSAESVAEVLFRIGALRFGRFTLSSGKPSSYYLDLRVVPSDPLGYSLVLEAYKELARRIGERNFDAIAGVATTGLIVSSPLAVFLKKPMVYVRGEEKGHGLGKVLEGAARPGWRVLVIDDLVTTGGSIVGAVETLRKVGCKVSDSAVLVDRLEGGEKNLSRIGVRLNSFTNVMELAKLLYEAKMILKREEEEIVSQIIESQKGSGG